MNDSDRKSGKGESEDLLTSYGEVVRRVDLDRAAGTPGRFVRDDPSIAGYEGVALAKAALAGDQAALDEFHELAGLALPGVTECTDGEVVRLIEQGGPDRADADLEDAAEYDDVVFDNDVVFQATNEAGCNCTQVGASGLISWILSPEGRSALARRGVVIPCWSWRRAAPAADEVAEWPWWWNRAPDGDCRVLQLDIDAGSGEIVDVGDTSTNDCTGLFDPSDWPGYWAPCLPPLDLREGFDLGGPHSSSLARATEPEAGHDDALAARISAITDEQCGADGRTADEALTAIEGQHFAPRQRVTALEQGLIEACERIEGWVESETQCDRIEDDADWALAQRLRALAAGITEGSDPEKTPEPADRVARDRRDLLARSVDELDLSVMAANCLQMSSIRTIGELTKMTREDLLRIRWSSARVVRCVVEALAEFGLSLAPSSPETGR